MAYSIAISHNAGRQLRALKAYQRGILLRQHSIQLSYQPTVETRNRKRMRPNPIAPWELRVGPLRVFYTVEEPSRRVRILAIGIKYHNRVIIEKEEVWL